MQRIPIMALSGHYADFKLVYICDFTALANQSPTRCTRFAVFYRINDPNNLTLSTALYLVVSYTLTKHEEDLPPFGEIIETWINTKIVKKMLWSNK